MADGVDAKQRSQWPVKPGLTQVDPLYADSLYVMG